MKDFIYIPIEAAKELPEKDGWYWVYSNYAIDEFKIIEVCQFRLGRFDEEDGRKIESWLKPIPLSELEGEIAELIYHIASLDSTNSAASGALMRQSKDIGESIINHLKQER